MFEWESLRKQKLFIKIPRAHQIVIHGYIPSNHILCVQGLEMELTSVQPFCNESRNVKKSFETTKERRKLLLTSDFIVRDSAEWLFKPSYVLWAWQRYHLTWDYSGSECFSTSQIRVRNVITRAILFSGTWVKLRRKTENRFPLWILFLLDQQTLLIKQ